MTEVGQAPEGVETDRPSVARLYDFFLGGHHNYAADRELGRQLIQAEPNARMIVRENRNFLGRAVRYLSDAGVRQYLDLGSGIPTQDNVHEIAQRCDPESRVVYVDNDLGVVAHSKHLLRGNPLASVISADLRQPDLVLGHPEVRRLIDFGQPVGLLLSGVLHFIPDDDDPWRITRVLHDVLAPGSYLVLGHASHEGTVTRAVLTAYNRSVSTASNFRSRDEILRFFDGFDLTEPGLVPMTQWRPDSPEDVPAGNSPFWVLVGVARKPSSDG